jgi:hypothetical protein
MELFIEDQAFLLSLDSVPHPPPFYPLSIINMMLKCCSHKEVFRVMISYRKSYLFFRRDKKNCHRCRFCCSLPLCTFNTTKGICLRSSLETPHFYLIDLETHLRETHKKMEDKNSLHKKYQCFTWKVLITELYIAFPTKVVSHLSMLGKAQNFVLKTVLYDPKVL